MNPFVITFVFFCLIVGSSVLLYRISALQQLQKKTFPIYVGISGIATSVLFTFVVCVLVFYNSSGVDVVCTIGIYLCIVLYVATKAQLYLFFVERIYAVHKGPNSERLSSPLYIGNVCLLLPYIVVFVMLILNEYSEVDQKENCRIGIEKGGTLPLIVYDSFFSLYAVVMFLWPLYKTSAVNGSSKLLKVARKNAIGTAISMISSFLNVLSVHMDKKQMADTCLTFCSLDVMVNVLVMNYLISGGNKKKKFNRSGSDSMMSSSRQSSFKNISGRFMLKIHPSGCDDESTSSTGEFEAVCHDISERDKAIQMLSDEEQ